MAEIAVVPSKSPEAQVVKDLKKELPILNFGSILKMFSNEQQPTSEDISKKVLAIIKTYLTSSGSNFEKLASEYENQKDRWNDPPVGLLERLYGAMGKSDFMSMVYSIAATDTKLKAMNIPNIKTTCDQAQELFEHIHAGDKAGVREFYGKHKGDMPGIKRVFELCFQPFASSTGLDLGIILRNTLGEGYELNLPRRETAK